MNAKFCKHLRKEARKLQPYMETTYLPKKEVGLFLGQSTLNPNCFRGIYQNFKKAVRAGVQPRFAT